jgi:predicted transcriptional regulator
MKIVTLDVRDPSDSMADSIQAWKTGKSEKSARISFASPELLWRVLTEKRWKLLKVLCGTGPVSIREAARRVGRDVKAVHGDVTALLNAGILVRTDNGRIVFPFEAVKVEILLHILRHTDIKSALGIAIRFNLYAYDAYFLECAKNLHCPLLTLDLGMQRVAKEMGITILE